MGVIESGSNEVESFRRREKGELGNAIKLSRVPRRSPEKAGDLVA